MGRLLAMSVHAAIEVLDKLGVSSFVIWTSRENDTRTFLHLEKLPLHEIIA